MEGITPKKRLNDLLIEQGLVSAAQLRECLDLQRHTHKSLPALLIEKGYVAEEEMVMALSEQLGMAHIRVANYHISEEVLEEVPATLARQYGMLPVMLTGNVLTLAMSNPLNQMALDDLRLLTSHELELVIAMPSELEAAIDKYYKPREAPAPASPRGDTPPPAEPAPITPDTPVEVMVQRLIGAALECDAREVYIEPLKDRLRIRFRTDGTLEERPAPPKDRLPELVKWLKAQTGVGTDSASRLFHGHFISRAQERKTLCFVTALPSRYGDTLSLRLCARGEAPPDLASLEFEPPTLDTILETLDGPPGLLLVAGPRGSGRSTTLYSLLDRLATPERRVIAFEDTPVCLMEGIVQIPAGTETGLSYSQAIRHILRQQTDVLLIGELADPEAASMAVRAVSNGAMVLSTIGAPDAAGTFPALSALGVEPYWAASSVRLVIAQRMLRRICPDCKEAYSPPEDMLIKLQYETSAHLPEARFSRGRGCPSCRNTGYLGRIVCAEALRVSPGIQALMVAGASSVRLQTQANEEGMMCLRQAALAKAVRRLTTLEQVAANTIAGHPGDRVP